MRCRASYACSVLGVFLHGSYTHTDLICPVSQAHVRWPRSVPSSHSKEANDFLRINIVVKVEKARTCWQSRHGGHGTAQWVEEPCTHRGSHFSDWNAETRWCTLGVGVRREREVRLGHANGQVIKPLCLVARNVRRRLLRNVNTIPAVNVLDNFFNLLLNAQLDIVQEFEIRRLLCGFKHRLREVLGTRTAIRPMGRHHCIVRAGSQGGLTNRFHFGVCISVESVDGHHHGHAKLDGVLNVAHKIRAPGFEEFDILFHILLLERCAWRHLGSTTVHLEGTDRRHKGNGRWHESRLAALHVKEFFHANVGTKPSFRHNKSCGTNELECHLVRHDRRVSDGNVRKGASVHEHGCPFHRLHQCGMYDILEQDGESAGNAEVVRCDRVAVRVRGKDNAAQTLLKVMRVRGESEDGHEFRGDCNVKLRLAGSLLFSGALTDGNFAEKTIVGVHNAAPRDRLLVNVESRKLGFLFGRELGRVRFLNAQFLQPLELNV
eukprot:m.79154 g.79154  ORF g.79154 m.79154 type:complete len:491 (+) comp9269_c0_seq1:32-1504(+)